LHTPNNESGIDDSKGNEFFQEIKKIALTSNEGFIFHDTIYDKKDKVGRSVSFTVNYPEWKWIISASTSLDEVTQVIAQKKAALNKNLKKNNLQIFLIMTGLLLFAFILAKYVSVKTRSSFDTFANFFEKASTEAVKIDTTSLNFSEFSELAQMANQMIEKRQTAESMLKESESRFQQLAANIKEILWLISPTWDEILYISPAYEEIWGRSCESLYKNPRSWMDSIHEDDFESVSNYLQSKTSGDLSNIIFPEYRVRRPDGSIRWILLRGFSVLNKEGEVYRIVSVAEDITERKQSENEIQTLVVSTAGITGQNFFDDVVKHLCNWLNCEISTVGEIHNGTGIKAISMVVDGKLNHDFYYELGGTPCEIAHKDGLCYYPDNIVSQFPDDKDLALLGAEGYVGTQILNRQGQVIGILNVLSRSKLELPKRAKEVLNIIAARVSAEIERRDAELEKTILEEKLRQSQKMEAIGTLAGGIAHDFNNILGAVLGYAEMVQEDCPTGSVMRSDIDRVIEASQRAKDLVKQILAFSRQAETEERILQPALIIKEAIKILRASLPTTIDIHQNIDPETALILADPTQIHQIIINLCTNAFHAMEERGGTLNISLKNKELTLSELFSEPHVQPGHFVEICVGDNGPGIAPEIMDKIFDPFFTTKDIGKGTGMGLAIIHGIAKKSGGFVSCKSSPGEGTNFHVYLPIHTFTPPPESETTPVELIQTGTEHILFIDDEEMLAEMSKAMLERLGYTVTVETNSIQALKIIKNQPNRFDLVITDQTMPGMTGSDLARRMLQIRPGLPIILCTGFSNQISEEKARIYGIKGFAMKPLAKKDLASLIRKVLDEEKQAV